jgi:ADP-heptose:LPS heptosyltransferase
MNRRKSRAAANNTFGALAIEADHGNDRNRSIPPRTLSRLLGLGADFVTPHPGDVAETAALLTCIDLVITVDTSVAHLAGSLGRPTWLLLPHVPDHRWLLEREDSPWYPTMCLFRQDQRRDWEPVTDRVRSALAARIAAGA